MNDRDAPDGARSNEAQRLAALKAYRILDTAPEADFDDIVKIAAQICDVPMALISLVDDRRQWFKAAIGLAAAETPREIAFCAHAIEQDHVFLVEDATKDPRFAENPLVTDDPNLRFYAGTPLATTDGHNIGTLCVLDSKPRELDDRQIAALEALGRQVMAQLELRRALAKQHSDDVRHQRILESAVDYAIISLDLTGRVTSWNEGAHQIMGWTEEEMFGRLCDVFFTPEDRAAGVPDQEMGTALARGRGTDERWHLCKNGSRFWANGEMMPLTDSDGTPVGFLKILRDRTEQHRTRTELEVSERRFQLALEAAQLGAWDGDPSFNHLTVDPRARLLLGHAADAVVEDEAAFFRHVHPDDQALVEADLRPRLGAGERQTLEAEFRTISSVDREPRWVHLVGRMVEGSDGTARIVGTVRDISTRKASEEHHQIVAGELQHRINNTLAIVQAIVGQSLRSTADPDEARTAIGERLAALASAHRILTQTSWTAAPIRAIIAAASGIQIAEPGRVSASGPATRLNARAALALAMVLHELCTNASKYGALSNDTGTVEITWNIGHSVAGSTFEMVWQERGGPSVAAPTRKGFGTRLIETSLAHDLGGVCTLAYPTDGFKWTLNAQLSEIVE